MSETPVDNVNFVNPNFALNAEDELNCNTSSSAGSEPDSDDYLHDAQLYEDLQTGTFTRRSSMKSRAAYNQIDVGCMGVDVNVDPTKNLPHVPSPGSQTSEGSSSTGGVDKELLQHVKGPLNEDIYAVVHKKQPHSKKVEEDEAGAQKLKLPRGWEKHEDENGAYYWHVKSGTIQRDLPEEGLAPSGSSREQVLRTALMSPEDAKEDNFLSKVTSPLSPLAEHGFPMLPSPKSKENWEQQKLVEAPDYMRAQSPTRFAVQSLGWVEISEDDLTPEKSSRAVNKCIVNLTQGRNDLELDAVGRWGDGKDLYMDLDGRSLQLIDTSDMTVLHSQPIHSIRVWGVGRDNARDFAYVSRDRITRKHMCHVFRCDSSARTIANQLRDICKRIMMERSTQHNLAKPITTVTKNSQRVTTAQRPTFLQMQGNRSRNPHKQMNIQQQPPIQSFPTPMEEPKKILKAHYLGSIQVSKSTGMDTLNDAIDEMLDTNSRENWKFVHVAVAPSTVTILEPPPSEKTIVECRVRFLSFLGIGKDVKTCAFILHTANDSFSCHAFHCEPSSGALCKTIEAACKLRYQKCLDAQQNRDKIEKQQLQQQDKGITSTLKNMIGQITGRKLKT